MSFSQEVDALLSSNDIRAGLEACKARLKTAPSDPQARQLYIDLLILVGDYERADNQCGLAATLDSSKVMSFAMLRHQLRGMAARNAWYETGAVPEFPDGPTGLDTLALKLAVADRAGNRNETGAALTALETARAERPMSVAGQNVSDFRDLDDRLPHAFEVIMGGGSYLWVDYSRVRQLRLDPISRPRDLAFRPAQLTLMDGATAPVLIPAIYHGTAGDDATQRLGRSTEWVETMTGLTVGLGQRCFLSGETLVPFHELGLLENIAAEEAVHG